MNSSVIRLATCCLLGDVPNVPKFSYRTMTKSKWEKTRDYAELYNLWQDNIGKTKWLLEYLGRQPETFHFLRMTSDLLPLVTLPDVWDYYTSRRDEIRKQLKSIGESLRNQNKNFRLVMHPGQFTLLNSVRPEVNANSLIDLEYHYDMLSAFGFPYSINIHLGAGPCKTDATGYIDRFIGNWSALPTHLQDCLSIENDEKVCDLSTLVKIYKRIKILICYDHHHQACYLAHPNRLGKYTYYQPTSEEVAIIRESWSRTSSVPTCHLSNTKIPNGTWKDLFSHSDYLHDESFNSQALQFQIENGFDLECEAKAKFPAVQQLHAKYLCN